MNAPAQAEMEFSPSKATTLKVVRDLKEKDEDFEWYPTTERMVKACCSHFSARYARRYESAEAILDCGAGDGRVLMWILEHLRESRSLKGSGGTKLLAIEKSPALAALQPKRVMIVGSDFETQTLYDKEACITFCNPPYSQFEAWAVKVLRETPSKVVYMVLPSRWSESDQIKAAMERRKIKHDVIQSDTFRDAHRQARAEVEVIGFVIPRADETPFGLFIRESYPELDQAEHQAKTHQNLQAKRRNDIVESGGDFATALAKAYRAELDEMQRNYNQVRELDPTLLKELQVSCESIAQTIWDKMRALKTTYWKTLIDNIKRATRALTAKRREDMLRELQTHTAIDFTLPNIGLVLDWISRNAYQHTTDQTVELWEDMLSKANCRHYKSNQKIFGDDDKKEQAHTQRWRFVNEYEAGKHTRIKLDYRLVIENKGGIHEGSWSAYRNPNNLSETAHIFLGDIVTVASTLGFGSKHSTKNLGEWGSGDPKEFSTTAGELIMRAKAFKNGNLHIQLGKGFCIALNTEVGRLKGWLLDEADAAENIDETAAAHWGKLNRLALQGPDLMKLEGPKE